jgi:hypothetical protein
VSNQAQNQITQTPLNRICVLIHVNHKLVQHRHQLGILLLANAFVISQPSHKIKIIGINPPVHINAIQKNVQQKRRLGILKNVPAHAYNRKDRKLRG